MNSIEIMVFGIGGDCKPGLTGDCYVGCAYDLKTAKSLVELVESKKGYAVSLNGVVVNNDKSNYISGEYLITEANELLDSDEMQKVDLKCLIFDD